MENKRSNGLLALCILSFISLAYQTFSFTFSISNGPATDEQIIQQNVSLLEGQTPETLETSRWIIEDVMSISKIQQQNFGLISTIDAIGLLLGFIAVILMFRLRKIGFHLYIVYTLISIFYWTYFFSGVGLAATLIVLSIAIGILFVILYGVQSKKWFSVKLFASFKRINL